VATGGGFVTSAVILSSMAGGVDGQAGWVSRAFDPEAGTFGVKSSVVCVDNPPFRG
jgi:hypothetical protein